MAIMRTACAYALLLLAAANAGTSPEGKAWLEAKAKEDGVVTLESGLMYKVLRDGDGENHPKASTSCECHYEGKLIDGTGRRCVSSAGTLCACRAPSTSGLSAWSCGS